MTNLIGQRARVTARVTSDTPGEVVVSVPEGGTETRTAYPYDGGSFASGSMVTIIETLGRVVYVSQ